MNRKLLAIGCVAVLIALAGCSSSGVGDAQATTSDPDTIHNKWADAEVGVICYVYEHSGYAGGSIECLPLDDQSNESVNFGDSPTQTELDDGFIRTIYPDETNVCYTYEHSGYAGGDTTCLDFSETNLED